LLAPLLLALALAREPLLLARCAGALSISSVMGFQYWFRVSTVEIFSPKVDSVQLPVSRLIYVDFQMRSDF
jgi:hypothetical protein